MLLYLSRKCHKSSKFGDPLAGDEIRDLELLRHKLENYRSDLIASEHRRITELEKQKPYPAITITNDNKSLSESHATATMSFSFTDTLQNIAGLPSNVLTPEEKEELEEKLLALEGARNNQDKARVGVKIGSVLKYIAEKGVEVAIATLPYLGEIAKLISTK